MSGRNNSGACAAARGLDYAQNLSEVVAPEPGLGKQANYSLKGRGHDGEITVKPVREFPAGVAAIARDRGFT
jgi:hypothetical protein